MLHISVVRELKLNPREFTFWILFVPILQKYRETYFLLTNQKIQSENANSLEILRKKFVDTKTFFQRIKAHIFLKNLFDQLINGQKLLISGITFLKNMEKKHLFVNLWV